MKRGPPVGSKVAESDGGDHDGLSFPRSQDHFERFTNLIRWELEDEMESVEETEEVVREYKEKAPAPVSSEQGDGKSGPVAKKNDMGGKAVDPTGEEAGGSTPKSTTQTDASDTTGSSMSKA